MEELNKITERIRKLIALSTSPNENEATVAMEKAQALLIEYSLSMDEVLKDGNEIKKPNFAINSEFVYKPGPAHRRICNAVSALYFCSYFFTRTQVYNAKKDVWSKKTTHNFIGTRANTEVAHLMSKYLVDTIDRLALEGSKSVPKSKRNRYKIAFRYAAGNRISARIRERIQAAKDGKIQSEGGTNLPAIVDQYNKNKQALEEFISETVPLKSGRKTGNTSSFAGTRDGRVAGDKVSLDTQVGSREHQDRIGTGAKKLTN